MHHAIWRCLEGARILDKQKALITGAASGIGKACALLFAYQGADLVLVDRDHNLLEEAAREILAMGGQVHAVTADVTNKDDISNIFVKTLDAYDGLDILINNAGGGLPTGFFEISLEEWQRVVDLNLTSVFAISQRAARIFKERGRGSIVNVSSLAGRSVSVTAGCHYTSSKAGILGLTRHMARVLAQYNIRVNAVCPGVVNSKRILERLEETGRTREVSQAIPLGRVGDVSEVAACCAFLASDMAGFITGASLDVNGGALMV
jgi:3-oxoacyl-[acyl-carrier protein] reductase